MILMMILITLLIVSTIIIAAVDVVVSLSISYALLLSPLYPKDDESIVCKVALRKVLASPIQFFSIKNKCLILYFAFGVN